jgi:hypothetical protein
MKQCASSPTPPVGSVLRERDELRERRRERRGVWRRDGRGPAHGAGPVPPQPGVEARDVEAVPTLGHHAQHLAVPVLAEADGAHGVGGGGPAAERDLGVGRNGGEVETDGRRRRGGGRGVGCVGGLGALSDEEHARDGDGDVSRAGGRRDGARGVPGPVVPAAGVAAAEVRREEEGREQDEEAERDGDGVAEAEVGERGEEGHGGGRGRRESP